MEHDLKKILRQVKDGKKYRTISDGIIIKEIKDYLKSNPRIESNRQLIKNIRKQLHLYYSSFQTKKKKKAGEYIQELEKTISSKPINAEQLTELTKNLLSTTLSTKERSADYEDIYNKIFKTTKKPRTILDIGSGMNPFSFPFMNLEKISYYAYDIDEQDIKILNKYFRIMKPFKLKGRAEIIDINDKEHINKLPLSDIIFMFKLIDIIDKKNHKPSEELITQLLKKQKTKFIVASFATKTLTRKPMGFPKRKWFELMLKRNNLKFKPFKTDNEIFYIVRN